MKSDNNTVRITISLNKELSKEADILMKKLKISKSELFKTAFEKFYSDYKKQNLAKIAEMMKNEYEENKELTSFIALDGENFL